MSKQLVCGVRRKPYVAPKLTHLGQMNEIVMEPPGSVPFKTASQRGGSIFRG